MAWARLDDGWHDHPKTIAAGPEAAGVWAMCLTWAYKQRRKSANPGVVPEAVIARFAGSRTRQVVARLHSVRYFDDRTDYGWPIHDFADYLPKYDSEQAARAGSKGGSTKRNPSKPLSEPLSKPLSDSLVEHVPSADEPPSERPSEPPSGPPSGSLASTRASPKPTKPSLRSGSVDVGRIVAAWVEAAQEVQGDRPSSALVSRVGRQVKALLKEGKDPTRLETAARSCGEKGYDDIGRELLRLAAAANGRRQTETTGGWDA